MSGITLHAHIGCLRVRPQANSWCPLANPKTGSDNALHPPFHSDDEALARRHLTAADEHVSPSPSGDQSSRKGQRSTTSTNLKQQGSTVARERPKADPSVPATNNTPRE